MSTAPHDPARPAPTPRLRTVPPADGRPDGLPGGRPGDDGGDDDRGEARDDARADRDLDGACFESAVPDEFDRRDRTERREMLGHLGRGPDRRESVGGSTVSLMDEPEDVDPERPHVTEAGPVRIVGAREVPLGGVRALRVRRTLPARGLSHVGAWCFADHIGPALVDEVGGMQVPGHPHTGLQTLTWLFEGEIRHRDTTGAHLVTVPGTSAVMTAGRGIAHSEYSTEATKRLHGVQLWVALPDSERFRRPGFEHAEGVSGEIDGARVTVFAGELDGVRHPAWFATGLVGAELWLPPGRAVRLPARRDFEYGVIVDRGVVHVDDPERRHDAVLPGQLAFRARGEDALHLLAPEGARIVLLGGEPFEEPLVMWWNLIGRDHDEIIDFREQWQRRVAAMAEGRRSAEGDELFGSFPRSWRSVLSAPPVPPVRLRAR